MLQDVKVNVRLTVDKTTLGQLAEVAKAARRLASLIAALDPEIEVQAQQIRNGECSPNDVRRSLDLEPLPGGDERMISIKQGLSDGAIEGIRHCQEKSHSTHDSV